MGFLGGRELACVVSQVVAGGGALGEEVRGPGVRATPQGRGRQADGQVGGGGHAADCCISAILTEPALWTWPLDLLTTWATPPPQPSSSCLVAEMSPPPCHHGSRVRSLSRLLKDPVDTAHSTRLLAHASAVGTACPGLQLCCLGRPYHTPSVPPFSTMTFIIP